MTFSYRSDKNQPMADQIQDNMPFFIIFSDGALSKALIRLATTKNEFLNISIECS